MDAEIVQLINQFGVLSEGEYSLHPFHKASLYQIKRHLAVDNDKVVLLKCSEVNIIGNDIIPMMKLFYQDSEKKDLFLICLKVCSILLAPSSKVFEHMDLTSTETVTLISKRESYLVSMLKSIVYSDIMIYLNGFLLSIVDEEEKSDISIAIKESIFYLVQLIVSTCPKCMTLDEKSIVEGSLVSKMVVSEIIETMYKFSKASGYRNDMFIFIYIFGQLSKYIDPNFVVKAEVSRRKNEERIKKLPLSINIKELVKSIEQNLGSKKTKPLPDDRDPLFPMAEEINRKKYSQRRRIIMNGRFPGTFIDMNNFTKSGRAKVVNKIEASPMDSILKQSTFKSFHRNSIKPSDEGDERALSLTDKIYTKLYSLVKMLMLSGFDFKRYAYSDILTWCDIRTELMGIEANYLHLQWFMLKISRLDNIPWLFQSDFMTFDNIEIWTERIIDAMNKYEKPKVNYIREKCKYMINILKEALYRIPNLKERNEGEYRTLIYELYFHSYLKSFVKIYHYIDDHLSSQSLYTSLFSLTSIYFQMAKFINMNGGYCGNFEKNDALEVMNELIEIENLMGQFYSKWIARCTIDFTLNYNDKISPTELHNLISVIYYSSFGLRKMIFYFEVSFFVCLRKWVYTLKKECKNPQMLPVLENFLKRLMLHVEEYHLFGVSDSSFLNQISKPMKVRKKKAKELEDEDDFEEYENEKDFDEHENEENFEDQDTVEGFNNIEDQESITGNKLNKKISRVIIDDTSDVEEEDSVMEKLDSHCNNDIQEDRDNSTISSDEEEVDESDDGKENDSDEEYRDKPNELKPEDFFNIYNKKRSLFEDSDDENNKESEISSQRPLKKRKMIDDEEDDE